MSDQSKCYCSDEVDEELKGRNTRLSRAIAFGDVKGDRLMLVTEQIKTGRGEKKAVAVFLSYCPFCGAKY